MLVIGNESAGWSSQVARKAHNLEVAGSNPAPATNDTQSAHAQRVGFSVADRRLTAELGCLA